MHRPPRESKSKQKEETTFRTELAKCLGILKLFPFTLDLLRPQLSLIILAYLLSLLTTGLQTIEPRYVGTIVDIVTRSKDSEDLKDLVFKMVIFTTLLKLIRRLSDRVSTRASERFRNSAKVDIYRSILQCDMAFFDKLSTSEAAHAMSYGVDALQRLYFKELLRLLQTILSLVGSLWLMYETSPKLTGIVLIVTPAKFIATYISMKMNSAYWSDAREVWKQVWTLPNQAIQNISLIKSFSTEEKEYNELKEKQIELTRLADKKNGGYWDFNIMIGLIENMLGAILVYFGGTMAFQGILTPGELSTFNLYYMNFNKAFSSINESVRWLYQSFMESEKILKILETNGKEKEQETKGIKKEDLKGSITVENLSFSYPSKPEVEVLKNINLKINAGECIAFVGASGSGKTTMISLLQNLYTPTKGQVIVDGEKLQDYDIAWLHKNMGYVSQEPMILEKTVEQNIVYGIDSYTPEQINKALDLSNAKFILNKENFPDGLSTKIGPQGIKLSGGQKQRIAIARAFIKDPKILLLDEPTSALDGESESQVQKAIDELTSMGDRTVIVVAHRLSTIINCSKIIVFENGKIVEVGTHKDLVKKEGVYNRLFEFQMNNMKNL